MPWGDTEQCDNCLGSGEMIVREIAVGFTDVYAILPNGEVSRRINKLEELLKTTTSRS